MTQSTESGVRPRATNKPVHTVRYGNVRAAVWRNVVDLGDNSRPMYGVTLTRSYKDGNDWKDASSFGLDDLLVLAKAANDAHTWIAGQRTHDAAEQQSPRTT